jgi:phosphoribosylglycinamide formyltransferase-1
MSRTLPIAVLISGGGTTLRNLIQKQSENQIDVDFRLVVSSRSDAAGLQIAASSSIPTTVVRKLSSESGQEHSARVFDPIRALGVQYVIMGGYLQHVLIPDDFENRVINIHPSLIPAFCGKGMYGLKVHQAAIDFGVRVSGCTVHFVDNQYDHGPIILQKTCEVLKEDTAESLQQRVFALECEALPEAIRQLG